MSRTPLGGAAVVVAAARCAPATALRAVPDEAAARAILAELAATRAARSVA